MSCPHPPCIGLVGLEDQFSICRVASKASVDGDVGRCVQDAKAAHPSFSTAELKYACRRQAETLEIVGEACGCDGSSSKPDNPRVCQWVVGKMCEIRPDWLCYLK